MSDVRILDALGTHCPVPVRLLARAIARAPADTQFQLLADDPLVAIDVPAWCHTHGHEILAFSESGGTWTVVVRAAHRAPRPRPGGTGTPPPAG
jgi:tRNA 2-thiouridine synthesizing protein A